MPEASLPAVYSQLLGVGALWIWLHCAGMCGPIVVGLDVAGARTGSGLGGGALRLLAYQSGRAITYSLLGVIAGLAGAGLKTTFAGAGGLFTVIFGGVVLALALLPTSKRQPEAPLQIGRARSRTMTDRLLDLARERLLPLTVRGDLTSRLLLGAALGLMPCMITLWALGLAASSGSPLHGAGVMVLLVALTTPTLALASLLARPLQRLGKRRAAVLRRVLLGASGIILCLAGLAALDVIGHAHLGFMAAGRHWMIMFW